MARIDRIITSAHRAFSIEMLPPERYKDAQAYAERIAPLMDYQPSFATITYHQERMEEQLQAGGQVLLQPRKIRAGPDITAAYFQGRFPRTPFAPHFICGGFSKRDTENAAVQLPFVGIENIIIIRGDPNYGSRFRPHPEGHAYADGLVAQISAMRNASYLAIPKEPEPIDLCIGIAGYPEKHYASPNLEYCLGNLKRKQDKGANFILTQMCFDNEMILRYRDLAVKHGITIPIVPGLKVMDSFKQASGETGIPANFTISIPPELYGQLEQSGEPRIGIDWAVNQAEGLYEAGFRNVHFYTNNKPASITPVLDGLGFSK